MKTIHNLRNAALLASRWALVLASAIGLEALAAGQQPSAITLDAPPGHFEEWKNDAEGFIGIKARVTVVKAVRGGAWSPGITAIVASGSQQVMMQVALVRAEAPMVIAAVKFDGQTEISRFYFKLKLDSLRPFDVHMRWTEDGEVCLAASQFGNAEFHRMELSNAAESVSFHGVGGEYRLDPVELVSADITDEGVSTGDSTQPNCETLP